jgi:hypothetical protein
MVETPEKREVKFYYDEDNSSITYELTTIWQIKDKVEGVVNLTESEGSKVPKFKVLVIDGVSYDLVKNKMNAMWAFDNYIVAVMASQADGRVKTPMMQLTINRQDKIISVE